MGSHDQFTWILGLGGFRVERMDQHVGEVTTRLRIHIERRGGSRYPCGGCGRPTRRVRSAATRTWDDLPWAAHPVTLVYRQRRVSCRRCGIRTEQVEFFHSPRADLERADVTSGDLAHVTVRFLAEFRSRTKGPEGEGKYVIFVPKAYKADTAYPLILFLHGAGSTGNDGEKQVQNGLAPAIKKNSGDFPFLVVFPQSQEKTWKAGSKDANRALAILAALFALFQARARQWAKRRQAQEAFARQLLASQEHERKRIAGELHDGLSQDLQLIKNRAQLALNYLAPASEVQAQLSEISAISARAIAGTRAISYALRPPELEHFGLTRAIEVMVDRIVLKPEIRSRPSGWPARGRDWRC